MNPNAEKYNQTVYFGDPKDVVMGFLSNKSNWGIQVDGKWYPSVFSYMQACKFTDSGIVSEIVSAKSSPSLSLLLRGRIVYDIDGLTGKTIKKRVYGKGGAIPIFREVDSYGVPIKNSSSTELEITYRKTLEIAIRKKFENKFLLQRLINTGTARLVEKMGKSYNGGSYGTTSLTLTGYILETIRREHLTGEDQFKCIPQVDSDIYPVDEEEYKTIVDAVIHLTLKIREKEAQVELFSEMINDGIYNLPSSELFGKYLVKVVKYQLHKISWDTIFRCMPNFKKVVDFVSHEITSKIDKLPTNYIDVILKVAFVVRWYLLCGTTAQKEEIISRTTKVAELDVIIPQELRWYRTNKPPGIITRDIDHVQGEGAEVDCSSVKVYTGHPEKALEGYFYITGKIIREHKTKFMELGGTCSEKLDTSGCCQYIIFKNELRNEVEELIFNTLSSDKRYSVAKEMWFSRRIEFCTDIIKKYSKIVTGNAVNPSDTGTIRYILKRICKCRLDDAMAVVIVEKLTSTSAPTSTIKSYFVDGVKKEGTYATYTKELDEVLFFQAPSSFSVETDIIPKLKELGIAPESSEGSIFPEKELIVLFAYKNLMCHISKSISYLATEFDSKRVYKGIYTLLLNKDTIKEGKAYFETIMSRVSSRPEGKSISEGLKDEGIHINIANVKKVLGDKPGSYYLVAACCAMSYISKLMCRDKEIVDRSYILNKTSKSSKRSATTTTQTPTTPTTITTITPSPVAPVISTISTPPSTETTQPIQPTQPINPEQSTGVKKSKKKKKKKHLNVAQPVQSLPQEIPNDSSSQIPHSVENTSAGDVNNLVGEDILIIPSVEPITQEVPKTPIPSSPKANDVSLDELGNIDSADLKDYLD